MFKTAQHHHALGADLQDLLLEDEEKVAVLGGPAVGAVAGGFGRQRGIADAKAELRKRGLSDAEIQDLTESRRVRGLGGAALSGLGFNVLGVGGGAMLGGKIGAIGGGLVGAGYGFYKNRRKARRDMIDEADRQRGRRMSRKR